MAEVPPANWHPDPLGRYELRYWSGTEWTHHVSTRGEQAIDPPIADPGAHFPIARSLDTRKLDLNDAPVVSQASSTAQIDRRAQRQADRVTMGQASDQGAGHLLTAPVLVINQKGRLFETNAEYAVYNHHGQRLGSVHQIGENLMKKALAPENRKRRLLVKDATGHVLMSLVLPRKIVRSRMHVAGPNNARLGSISERSTIFRLHKFELELAGKKVGSILSDRGYSRGVFVTERVSRNYAIKNAKGAEVGQIAKTRTGLANGMFTKADNYVVEFYEDPAEPLRSLAIAGALAIDSFFHQN